MTLRIGSLFSGYGGLDMAALQLFPGSSVAWHCEWDAAPSKILAHHWPDVPNHHDVTTLNWGALEPVDVLTGGYPCQPFSAAGRRKGTADERHLWPYVRHAIRALRPRFTLLENVAGHRSMGFDRVLGDCAEDGLHVQWTSVRASDVGACHRRERLFILVTDPNRDAVRIESVTEPRGCGSSKLGRVGEGLVPLDLLPTPSTADGMGGHLTRSGSRSSELLLPGLAKAYAEGKLELLPTPNASDGSGGGQHPDKRIGHSRQLIDYALLNGSPAWGKYEPAIVRQGFLSRPAPSPTVPSRKGNPQLAPPFPEWMMFLPAGHVTDPAIGLSRNEQLKAIGNGVCPPQAVAAYSWMLARLEVAA